MIAYNLTKKQIFDLEIKYKALFDNLLDIDEKDYWNTKEFWNLVCEIFYEPDNGYFEKYGLTSLLKDFYDDFSIEIKLAHDSWINEY